jgi:hypothetical protein
VKRRICFVTGQAPRAHSNRARRRARSNCQFRNRGTDYISESGMKWMSGGARRQCDRALARCRRGRAQPLLRRLRDLVRGRPHLGFGRALALHYIYLSSALYQIH